MFKPASTPGSSKYGPGGQCRNRLLNNRDISENAKMALEAAGEFGLAKSTWNTYRTVERLVQKCSMDRNRKMEVPLTEDDTLEFIGWLLEVRKVKGKTIESYLAGIRQLHIMRGATPPTIRTELVNLILKGIENRDNIVNRRAAGRLPITMAVMKLLKN